MSLIKTQKKSEVEGFFVVSVETRSVIFKQAANFACDEEILGVGPR